MSQSENTPQNSGLKPPQLCQIEIPVTQLENSLTFYREVFGWTPAPIEIHNYIVLQTPEDLPYGVSLIPHQGGSPNGPQMTLYFAVSSRSQLVEITEKVNQYGGSTAGALRKLPGYGAIQLIQDPNGHRLGLFVPGSEKSIL